MKMKNKRRTPDALIAIILASAIVIGGSLSMVAARNVLPDYKNSIVNLSMPEGSGLYFAQSAADISSSYPWDAVSTDTVFTSGAPLWLENSKSVIDSCLELGYSSHGITELTYAEKGGVYYIKSKGGTDPNFYSADFSAAFYEGGRLISFEVKDNSGDITSEKINTVYEVITESAFSNQNRGDELVRYLEDLTNGLYVYGDEYEFNEEDGSYIIQNDVYLSYTDTDPVRDFFRRYCSYCSQNGVANTDALYIYTLLRYGTYASMYSDGLIYLMYTIADFGTLTLTWNVATERLCGMMLDAREVNAAQIAEKN